MTNSFVNQINQSKSVNCILKNIWTHEINRETSTKQNTGISIECEL